MACMIPLYEDDVSYFEVLLERQPVLHEIQLDIWIEDPKNPCLSFYMLLNEVHCGKCEKFYWLCYKSWSHIRTFAAHTITWNLSTTAELHDPWQSHALMNLARVAGILNHQVLWRLPWSAGRSYIPICPVKPLS